MPRFRFQRCNDISGFCIRRIPLCSLSYRCCKAPACQSQKICPVALSYDWKTKRKGTFLPEDNTGCDLPRTEPSRDKAHSASTAPCSSILTWRL